MYCQSEIEGGMQCPEQCSHCKEYYEPLEQTWYEKHETKMRKELFEYPLTPDECFKIKED